MSALRARGFRLTSPSLATRGFFVLTLTIGTCPHTHTGRSGGHMQPCDISVKTCFTILSSSEWYEITQILPPGFAHLMAAKPLVQHVELVVHLDAQRLERLAGRVSPVAAPRGGDAGLDGLDQLERRLDGLALAPLDDLAGDPGRVLLVPIDAEDPGEVGFVVGVDDL